MATAVLMPKLGLTMEEGTIVRWLKDAGGEVAKDEAVAEIETDKANVQIEAEAGGLLGSVLYPEGSTVPVGKIIAYLVEPGEEPPKVEVAPAEPVVEKTVRPAEVATPVLNRVRGKAPSSPRARKLAEHLRIDLNKVEGSGPGGRIIEQDVRRAAEFSSRGAFAVPSNGQVEPLKGVRKVVAERMAHSFATAPHFVLSAEVDASGLLKERERLLPQVREQTGVRVTVSDLLIAMTAKVLQEQPGVNAAWSNGGVLRQSDVNVGLALASDRGLVVPIFHEANRKSIGEIATERDALVRKSRAGGLDFADLEGGTFTISNLGMYGVDQFNAIINPPQAAILAVGRVKERPFVVDGELAVRPTVFLNLSVDHRILDGAEAALFLGRLSELIEKPEW